METESKSVGDDHCVVAPGKALAAVHSRFGLASALYRSGQTNWLPWNYMKRVS